MASTATTTAGSSGDPQPGGVDDGGIQLTALPSPLTMKPSPAMGPATAPATIEPVALAPVPAAMIAAAAAVPAVKDTKEKDAEEDDDDDEEGGAKPASTKAASGTPKGPVVVLTAEEKAAVRRVLDPNDNDPNFVAAMALWSDAQISYYLDQANAATTIVLNDKARRFIAGDVEAEPPVTLSWRNVGYTKEGEKTPRLHGLTGALRPKQTVCILGGPDAGITSFLFVLAGRNQGGVVTGEILLNGQKPDASIRRRVGLVPKDDLHLAVLTAQETLEFSARLRLPNVIPDRVKRIRAQTIMKLLGLRHAAQTLVGSDTIRGVSGGEKRRLSIGVEWVAGHQSLLMDLPTNGLDSATAYELTATYKTIAQASNRSLMCSLVQPSPELLDLFDTVMVMSGGYCVYYGPRLSVMHYFFGLGYQMPAPGQDDADEDGAVKSEPDYLEELSVQPEHFYQGEGVTDEKGQIVCRPFTSKPNPYSKTNGNSAANVAANAHLTYDNYPSAVKAADGTIATVTVPAVPATMADLDDIADSAHTTKDGAAVLAYIPRKSVVDGAPIPALSGGVQVAAGRTSPTDGNSSPNGLESKHITPAGIAITVAAKDANGTTASDFGGRDPNAPKVMAAIGVNTKSHHKVKISHFEGVQHLIRSWTESEYHRTLGAEVQAASSGAGAQKPNPETATDAYNTAFPYQLYLAMQRQFLLVWRDTATSVGAIMQAIIIALLVGSLFWQIGTNQKDMRTRFGLFFFVLMFQIMDSLAAIPGLMDQRLNYYAQTSAGWYRGPSFYFAYVVARMPLTMLSIFIFFIIEYPMSGLTGGVGSEQFGFLLLLVLLTAQCGKAWCLFIGAISPTQPVAMALTPVTMILFTMFCGFMVPRDSIPNGWIWVYYLSFFTWSVRGAAQNELVPLTFNCDPEEYLQISPFARPVCPIPDGVAALAQYDMEPAMNADGTPDTNEKWIMMRNLMFFFIAFNIAACLALLRFHWFHNDNSSVTQLTDSDDDEVADKQPTKEVDATGKTVAVANGHGKAGTPRSRSRKGSRGTPRSRGARTGNAAKRAAAAGHTVITVQPADATPAQVDVAAAAGPARTYEMKVTPTTLSFANLTYKIDLAKPKKGGAKQKELLIKTFGFVKPGTCVALMGPSGAGKTTLLDVLANKKNGGYTRGSLLINGKPRDKDFQLISGYVEQTDSHNPFSTVREAIEFSARLRLPPDMSEVEKMERVEAVLDKLGLRPYAHRQIGSVETGGVSPEIRKKVTIGVELVMNPAILFLDEPTTGLDSMAAMAVMEAVRKLAATISVVCTVHQPSAEIVAQFDTMLLMQKGGRVAYHGPISQLSDYLGSVGLGKCPEGRNIADHALEVAGGGIAVKTAGGKDPATLFAASPQYAAIQRELAELGHNVNATEAQIPDIPLGDGVQRGVFELDTTSEFMTQYKELSMRFMVSIYRDTPTFRGRMGNAVIIAFILSTLYFQLGSGQADAANRVSLFYLTGLFPCFSAGEIIPKIVGMRPIYFRERQAKMYSPFAYFLARFTGQLPYIFLEGTIYCVVMYFVANLTLADGGMHFWIFLATYYVMRMSGFAFAELGASLAEKAEAGAAFQSVLLTLFMLFAGFLVPRTGIPIGWRWMYYASIFRYPISLLANNELRDLSFECVDNKGAIGPLELFNRSATSDALTMTCTTPTDQYSNTNCFGYICPYTSGSQMLKSFDMDGDDVGQFFGIICLMVVGYQAISYFVLKRVQHIKR